MFFSGVPEKMYLHGGDARQQIWRHGVTIYRIVVILDSIIPFPGIFGTILSTEGEKNYLGV